MSVEWLRALCELPREPLAVVGIAVAISDLASEQIHAGVLHRGGDEPPHVLNLRWHACLENAEVPAELDYLWVDLALDPDRVDAVAAHCRLVAEKCPKIPYGVRYEGGMLTDEGTFLLAGGEVGWTCATFVLALLAWAGVDLLRRDTWMARRDDQEWLDRIVALLRRTQRSHGISDAHIAKVAADRDCVRYRPEEIAAATACAKRPVRFEDAAAAGADARAVLFARARGGQVLQGGATGPLLEPDAGD
jgi:hypothetical protein